MYVDPKLDILANSLQAVQKRHDENYAEMTALDLMAHNTKVAEGDRGIKDAALGKLKAQRDAIAASGDYAYAMPKIGAAVRDWGGNEDMIAAKNNKTLIDEAEKTKQAMRAAGHIDLDFNPSENWSTIDPVTKQRRTYSSKIEKQLDYDSRAQEVSKLLENTRDLGLTPANIRDYLKHGSITGISDERVKANLEGAIMRFMNSAEGGQMKRKLTGIDGMSGDQADDYISDYLYNVGKAQVHEKENVDYQVNSAALQRDQMAQTERHWQVEQADKRAQNEAENEIKRAKAAGQVDKEGNAIPNSPAQEFFNAASTTVAPETLKGVMTRNEDGSFKINTSGENIVDFAKIPGAMKPADAQFVSAYETLRNLSGDKDANPKEVERNLSKMDREVKRLQQSLKTGKNIVRGSSANKDNPEGWLYSSVLTPEERTHAAKELTTLAEKQAAIKKLKEEAAKQGHDLSDTKRYAELSRDPASFLGKALKLSGTGNFKMYTNQPNKVNVDGKTYLKGELEYTEDELSTILKNTAQTNGKVYDDNRGIWTTNPLKDDWQEVLVEKGVVRVSGTDPKTGKTLYSIPTQYEIQNTPSIRRSINKESTSEGMLKEYASPWEQRELYDDQQRDLSKKYNVSINAKVNGIKDPTLQKKLAVFLVTSLQDGNEGDLNAALHMRESELAEQLKDMNLE